MLEKLKRLQLYANENWEGMNDTKKHKLMNSVFEIALRNEEANDSAFELMSDLYEKIYKESAE